jgi:hypothetical protein
VLVLHLERVYPHLQLAGRIVLALPTLTIGAPLRPIALLPILLLILDYPFQHAVVLAHQVHLRYRISEEGQVILGGLSGWTSHLEGLEVVL